MRTGKLLSSIPKARLTGLEDGTRVREPGATLLRSKGVPACGIFLIPSCFLEEIG